VLELPLQRPRMAQPSPRNGSVNVRLDGELVRQAKELARLHELTLAGVLCAAWSLVLSRLSSQDNFVIGIPETNRCMRALWVRLEDDPPVSALLASVKEAMAGA